MNSFLSVFFLAASASAGLTGLGYGYGGPGLIGAYGYGAPYAASSYSYTAPTPVIKNIGYANNYAYGAGAYGAYGAAPYGYGAPYAAKAVVAVAPSSQYKAQDPYGNVNYGYANINSAKQESRSAYGGAIGAYSYVDANGLPQEVRYVADAGGFRILSATNLPVAPAVPEAPALVAPVDTGVAPAPVEDTPEVAAAKAEFQAAFDAAAAAAY